MSPVMICYVLAFVCFVIGSFPPNTPPLNWTNAGLAFLTLSLIVR